MGKKRRLAGAAAGCAVVIATAIGTPQASAQEVCIQCPPTSPGHFHKVDEPGYPTTPFLKLEGNTAFHKISDPGFQGEAFHKLIDPFLKYQP